MFLYFIIVPLFDVVLMLYYSMLRYVMLHYFDTDLFDFELFNVTYRKNGTPDLLRTQIRKGSWVLGPLRVLVPPFQVCSLMLLFLYCIKVALRDDALFDAALFRYCTN